MSLYYPEEKILNHRNFDSFFIDYSNEDLENNLLILAQLHFFGNHLMKKLDERFEYRKNSNNYFKYKEYIGSVELYSFLAQSIRPNIYHYAADETMFEKDYENFKNQLISNLEKYYLKQFSLEKLTLSFLENDEKEYLNQSKFFKVDFEKFPRENIEKKDKIENLQDYNSYNHLYNLLLNHITRYENSDLDWFTEMGMSPKQFEHCKDLYVEELRNRKLTDSEVKDLLKRSIVKLVEKVYF